MFPELGTDSTGNGRETENTAKNPEIIFCPVLTGQLVLVTMGVVRFLCWEPLVEFFHGSSAMKYVESESDRVLHDVLKTACPNVLATLANEYLGRLCVRWNAGFRPGGPKKAKAKRQLDGKREGAVRRTLHRQGAGRYQTVPVPNTLTTEQPLLECHRDGDRIIRHHNGTIVYIPSTQSTGMYFGESISAMETAFWEMVSDGTLRREQSEYGIVHGYRRCVRRAFSRIAKRAERERKVRMTSLDTLVATDVDGVPIAYGSLLADGTIAHEDETLLGRATAGDNEMLLAERVVSEAEMIVVGRLRGKRNGKTLLAISAYMAEGLSAQQVYGRLRENGARIGKRTVERMLADIRAEYAAAIAKMEVELREDTEFEPVSERIGADDQRRAPVPPVIRAKWECNQVKGAHRWTFPEFVEPKPRDTTGLVHFGHSLKYRSEIENEYKCSEGSWIVPQEEIDRQEEIGRRLDELCRAHGIEV